MGILRSRQRGDETNPNRFIECKSFWYVYDDLVIQLDLIYGSDTWVLKHIGHAMEQTTKLCESFIPYEEEEIKETKGKKV